MPIESSVLGNDRHGREGRKMCRKGEKERKKRQEGGRDSGRGLLSKIIRREDEEKGNMD